MDYSYYPTPQAPYQFLGFTSEPNGTHQNQKTNGFTGSASSAVSPACASFTSLPVTHRDIRTNTLILVSQPLTIASTIRTTSYHPISRVTGTLHIKAQHLQFLLPTLCNTMDTQAQLQSPTSAPTMASSNRTFFQTLQEMPLAMSL